jgi:hypothetical protein
MNDEGFRIVVSLKQATGASCKAAEALNPSSFILHPEISIARL